MAEITIHIQRPNYKTPAKWDATAEGLILNTWLIPFDTDEEVEDFLKKWTPDARVQAWQEFMKNPSNKKFTWSS